MNASRTSRTRICPRCYARADDDDRFCGRCGRDLGGSDSGLDDTEMADVAVVEASRGPTAPEGSRAEEPPRRWGRFHGVGSPPPEARPAYAPAAVAPTRSVPGSAPSEPTESERRESERTESERVVDALPPPAADRQRRGLVLTLGVIGTVLALLLVAVWRLTDSGVDSASAPETTVTPSTAVDPSAPSTAVDPTALSTTVAVAPSTGPAPTPPATVPPPVTTLSTSASSPAVRADPTYRPHRDPETGACLAVPDFLQPDSDPSNDPAPALRSGSTGAASFVNNDGSVWLGYQNEAAASEAELHNQYERALAFLPADQRTVAAPRNLHGGYSVSGRRDGLGYYISGVYVPAAQKIATFTLVWQPSADPALTASGGVTDTVFRRFPACG